MKMMKTVLVLFYISMAYFSSGFATNDEVLALMSIKSGLVDPLSKLQDWSLNNETLRCNWTGVSCNSNGSIENLNLSNMNLSGTISDMIQNLKSLNFLNLCCNGFSSELPNSVVNLTSLKILDVSSNFIVGKFPVGIGNAAQLTILNASSNSFSGLIPEDIGNSTLLEIIDLRGSFFEGSVPKSLKNLQNLKFLGLSGNNLTGQIPWELGELSSIETMIMGYNGFEGVIPSEFGNLANLKYLDLAVGNLGSEIPAELGKLKVLETVFLYKNNFEGNIPPQIGSITSLRFLDFSDNMLSGKIPTEIANLKKLQLMNLMCNQLSGSIPAELGMLPQLEVLELWNNSLLGPLPRDLGMTSPLQWLDVSSNLISGEIPENLCSGGNLTKLILFNNAFTGPIPKSLSSCASLVRVRIQNNYLSGPIPIGLGKLAELQRLELANNSLTGQIPYDLSFSASLSFIDVSRNKLRSSLPSMILSLPTLQAFMASNNELEGKIPDQFQDCPSMSVLDLSSNNISGNIPASIASCEKLVSLNLRNNRLTGEIPRVIAMMPALAILDLSNNSLTGGIPEDFGNSPALETINVSYNQLEGPVPGNGVLKAINPDDLVGNLGLCGAVLPPCSRNSSAETKPRSSHSRAKHILIGWFIAVASVLAIGIGLISARYIYKKWYSNGSCFEESYEMGKGDWPWRLMAFQRLRFTSSDVLACIKESNVIGMGATGIVYKAELHRPNEVVAVKKLWRTGRDVESGSSDEFVGEVNLLGKLRHRNIVRLLGFLHNDSNMMIIYEYMPNGSLGEALHGKQPVRMLIDWVSRYNIALGVAQGLAYLHHDCHPPIIHRDIKPNNILLDANLEATIADFGLARMMVRKNETVSMVAGSYGYIAPEYGYTLKVDEKIDVYSYGVVLLELLTAKRPLEAEFGESVDIVEWIRRKIRENKPLEEVLDQNIGNCVPVQEEMLIVLRIALLCTAKLPRDRPSIRDVLTMLGEAKPRRKINSIGESNNKTVFSTSPVNGSLNHFN